ncbi:MAG: hypothetical protein IPL59_05940 [Candidatus Competibacteraceae bacterium]|nr:hypothetical protein [Candidatus Competibacteraceae bacterium]
MYLPGKANFRNLSRYSELHEKTDSRGFRRSFDFIEFNRLSLADVVTGGSPFAVAIDASFIPKSGQCTYGLECELSATKNFRKNKHKNCSSQSSKDMY